MKRISLILFWILFVLVAFLPVGTVLLSYLGYTLELFSVTVFAIVIACLSVSLVVLDFVYKNIIENKVACVFLAVLVPLSIINAFMFVKEHSHVLSLVSGWACASCCGYLAVKYAKPVILKNVALTISALMAVPVAFFILLSVFFPIGKNTVVQTADSPSGRYYAEVVDSDQGALGGDTVVTVYEKWEINLFLFKIKKQPQQVYFGEWGEFKNMDIYWKNDRCIVINSVEHRIE